MASSKTSRTYINIVEQTDPDDRRLFFLDGVSASVGLSEVVVVHAKVDVVEGVDGQKLLENLGILMVQGSGDDIRVAERKFAVLQEVFDDDVPHIDDMRAAGWS